MRPSAVLRPGDAAQISEVIRFAATEKLAVVPCGGCTKLGIGSPPSRYDIALDLTRINRVLAYDPRDLTLGVEPGARIENLLQCLSEQRQFLPLVVPFSDRKRPLAALSQGIPPRRCAIPMAGCGTFVWGWNL